MLNSQVAERPREALVARSDLGVAALRTSGEPVDARPQERSPPGSAPRTAAPSASTSNSPADVTRRTCRSPVLPALAHDEVAQEPLLRAPVVARPGPARAHQSRTKLRTALLRSDASMQSRASFDRVPPSAGVEPEHEPVRRRTARTSTPSCCGSATGSPPGRSAPARTPPGARSARARPRPARACARAGARSAAAATASRGTRRPRGRSAAAPGPGSARGPRRRARSRSRASRGTPRPAPARRGRRPRRTRRTGPGARRRRRRARGSRRAARAGRRAAAARPAWRRRCGAVAPVGAGHARILACPWRWTSTPTPRDASGSSARWTASTTCTSPATRRSSRSSRSTSARRACSSATWSTSCGSALSRGAAGTRRGASATCSSWRSAGCWDARPSARRRSWPSGRRRSRSRSTASALPYRQSAVAQANEPDPERRAEIEEARLDVLDRELNPLHRRALERAHELARELGWRSYREMYEDLKQIDLAALERQTRRLPARRPRTRYEQTRRAAPAQPGRLRVRRAAPLRPALLLPRPRVRRPVPRRSG